MADIIVRGLFGDDAPGFVPASGGGSVNFLRADGTWAPAGGGAVEPSDGDKGDITVTASGMTWTIDADAVSNTKLANMSQSTVKGRAAGAGTGDPTDLTAAQVKTLLAIDAADVSGLGDLATEDTVDVSDVTGLGDLALEDTVSVDGTTIVGDGVATPLSVVSSPASGFYGSGIDGALTFDGPSNVTLASPTAAIVPVANVYTLTRDIFATNLTVDTIATIRTAGFRIFCTGTATINGTVQCNGGSASGVTGGTAPIPASRPLAEIRNGITGTEGVGGGASASVGLGHLGAQTANTAGGANGGVLAGGGGGANSIGTAGGAAVPASAYTTNQSMGWNSIVDSVYGRGHTGAGAITVLCGGGTGGSGTGAGSSDSAGGSGTGGGIVVLAARTVAGTGTVSANGGNGGNAPAGDVDANFAGGGGGGSGGVVVVISSSAYPFSVTLSAAGGTGGTAAGGAATNGGNGGTGIIRVFYA